MINPRQRGFTLIELIIFIVVVSAGLAGILSVINTVVKSSADPMVRKQTIAIAESLLEEILLKDYCDPDALNTSVSPSACGINTVESGRNIFDDVDDYNGYSSTGIFDMTGVATPGLEKYNILSVVVDSSATLGTLPVKRVTVAVTGPQGSISLTGYRAKDQ